MHTESIIYSCACIKSFYYTAKSEITYLMSEASQKTILSRLYEPLTHVATANKYHVERGRRVT